jgi:hypothetical protein
VSLFIPGRSGWQLEKLSTASFAPTSVCRISWRKAAFNVRARTIVRRTPKRTYDYLTIKSAPHQKQL